MIDPTELIFVQLLERFPVDAGDMRPDLDSGIALARDIVTKKALVDKEKTFSEQGKVEAMQKFAADSATRFVKFWQAVLAWKARLDNAESALIPTAGEKDSASAEIRSFYRTQIAKMGMAQRLAFVSRTSDANVILAITEIDKMALGIDERSWQQIMNAWLNNSKAKELKNIETLKAAFGILTTIYNVARGQLLIASGNRGGNMAAFREFLVTNSGLNFAKTANLDVG